MWTAASVPAAPTLSAVTPGDASVFISLLPPAQDGGKPVTSYLARVQPGGHTHMLSPTGTDTISGLGNGAQYTVAVAAVNEVGQGPFSEDSARFTPGRFHQVHERSSLKGQSPGTLGLRWNRGWGWVGWGSTDAGWGLKKGEEGGLISSHTSVQLG